MKQMLKTGKKALSVFMAVMMVLTAWVWVAPTDASAVTSGSYSYQLIAHVDNDFDSNASGYFTIYAKANNGTDSTRTPIKSKVAIDEDIFKGSDKRGTDVVLVSGTSTSFPCAFDFYSYKTSLFIGVGQLTIYLKVKVGNEWSTVCYEQTNAQQGQGEVETSAEAASTNYPTPSTIEWVSANTDDLIISDDADVNKTMTFRVMDQYGVRMSSTALTKLNASPEVKVSGTQSGNLDTDSSKDIYYTFSSSSSASYSVTVTATTAAKSKIYNKQEITVGATAGSLSLTDKVFVLHDPKYTVSFNKNASDASAMSPASYSVYYGESLASQATLDGASTYPTGGTRVGYTFLGMYDAATGGNLMNVNAEVTANKTYYAHWEILKYAAVFMDRSGDNVVLVQSDIPHGSAATEAAEAALKLSKIEYDDVNHYTLNESDVWNPTTNAVTGNTFFYPNYISSAHTLDSGTAIEATCQHGAGTEYKCTGCDYSYIEESSTTLGEHVKSDSYIVDTEATCTATGTGHYYCTVCGATVETVEIPAKGHSFKSEIIKVATCKETGVKKYSCTNCDYTEEETIPLTQHNYVAGETVAANCQHSPYIPYTCSVCGDTYNKYEGSATTNHNWSFNVSDVTANNTKVVTGTCSVCGATFEKEVELPATHNFTNIEITKQPTCKAEGEITISCADSGCTENYTATLPMVSTAHAEYTTTYTSAECGKAGSVVTKCKDCGVTISEKETDALKHSYDYVRVEPTCTTAGSITKTCANCGNVQTETIPATGHKTVTVEANCQHGGYVKCGVCDTVISETPKAAHDFSGEVKEVSATCTVDGIRFTKCKNCDAQIADILSKTGHNVPADFTVIIPATCEGKGYQTKTCSKCNVVLESEEIAPLNHNYVKDEDESYDPTCTEAGENVEVCSRCQNVVRTMVQAIGHAWTSTTHEADCTHSSYIEHVCGNDSTHNYIEYVAGSTALGHNYSGTETIISAATCEDDGEKTVKCTRCNETNTVVIPKLGHNWGEWKVTKASTNTEKGELTRTCLRGCTESVKIPAGGHNLVEDTTQYAAPTCTVEGKKVYVCENHDNCGITVTVTVPVTQHTVAQRENLATCTQPGSVEAYCSVCNVVLSTEEIPVKAHDFVAQTPVAATCTTSGYIPYTCSCGASYNKYNADEKATGHDYVKVENSSTATCTAEGTITLKCSVCNNEINVDVPALGHDYVEDKAAATSATCAAAATKTYKCSRCDAAYTISEGDKLTGDNVHIWGAWTVKESATPTSLGYQTRTCSLCGKLEVETLEAAGEHQFETGDITESKAATCTENGYEIRKCTVHEDCGKTATIVIPATGHDEVVNTVDATCEGEGTVITTCKNCDYKEVEDIPALGHLYEAGTGAVTPATCDAEGKIEYTCTRCNGETKTVIIPVDADAHNYKTTVKQATCVADGSVVTECLICGVKTTETIPATGHSWNSGSVSKKATCEEAGLRTLTCLKCAATSDEVIPALGHTYEAGEAVAPTCTTSGYTVYTCKNDSAHTYKVYDAGKPATGHTWSDWSIDTNATETTEGLKIRTCTCGETDEQIIPAMMHDMEKIESVASTCSQAGHITYKCKIDHEGVKCSYTLTVDLPLVAHALKTTVTEASCKDSGSVLTECTVCDYETIEALALKPHKLTVTTTAATCEGEGSVVEKCKVCGETKTTTIAALGHDFSGKETIVTPASCSDDGKKTIGCTRCDAVKEIIIPQTAHNFEPKEVVAATCTTSGYTVNRCACGREYNALDSDPIGHSWNKGEITKDATCTTDGEKTFTCTRDNCGATRTEVISKFGHSWGAWEVVVNPTATVDGLQMRKCLRGCGVTDSVVIPALGGTTTYTVTFVADGKVIATQTVVHGGSATAPEIGNKAPDANGHYSFIWDTDFTKVTEDLTVTAVYTQAAHNYGEWITDIEATCKAQGKQHRVCADCSYTQTQTVAVKSHDYSVVKSEKEATCTESGYTVRACSYCGTTTTETTMRLGHTMTYHEYIPETCDTDGSMAYYSCSRCGKNFADRLGKTELTDIVISKKYHTFIVSEGKDPTCTAEGVTDYLYCTSCGFTQNPSSIPALGHVDANKDNACDRCGGTYMEGGEIVCTCNCHKSGIFNELIYKILLFFWRLFGMNKSCACGRVHY